jgi:protein-S-isoprenylcysteine O-methyltransferase Ste14
VLAEVNLFGVFINAGLASAFFAGVLLLSLRKALTNTGAYRWVWHPALVDLALFMLLWGLVAFVVSALDVRLLSLLG